MFSTAQRSKSEKSYFSLQKPSGFRHGHLFLLHVKLATFMGSKQAKPQKYSANQAILYGL